MSASHRQAMLMARLECHLHYIETKINTNSVQYVQYQNLYLQGKISWTQFLEQINVDLNENIITIRGNGSQVRARDLDNIGLGMLTVAPRRRRTSV